jgi:protein-S-isoprenylcysteine O-methyltransferase Ste14
MEEKVRVAHRRSKRHLLAGPSCERQEPRVTSQDLPHDAAAVRVFPPAVPLTAILIGYGIGRLWPIDLHLAAAVRYGVGFTLLAVVVGVGLWSVVLFRRSGQDESPFEPTPHIVDRGPYRVTRNPMYLQLVLFCVAMAFVLANIWILVLTPLVVLALCKLAIEPEEAYLERKFGDTYRDYKRRVRRWL